MFTSFLFAEAFYFKKQRMFIIATVLSVLMAISRMYLGVHFFEDVFVSIILGILTAYVISIIFRKLNDKQLHILYLSIIGIFLPIVLLIGEEDLFKTYGLMVGFYFAMTYEKKYINFSLDISLLKKAVRVLSGLVVMLTIQIGLGAMFDMVADEGSYLLNILDLIRYGLISFIGLGIYPMLFNF